ncbi:MAG: trypsin-like peptidase domain-containing protein [Rhodobacteraceae bacterium]|nr:trypsin-like peptidase domain-containing protein [Paracoccaceae bacterium]
MRRLVPSLLLMALSGPSAAQGTGPREMALRDALLGWEAVGRVEFPDGSYCTGTLIETDVVLTAAHCLFDAARGQAAFEPAAIRFRAGPRNDEAVAERGVAATAVDPGFAPAAPVSPDRVRHDMALLRLDAPIPAATAAPFPVAVLPPGRSDVAVVSFAAGREAALSIERSCHVKGRAAGLYAFDCDVSFGSSGAPVFDTSARRARIVSIISAGNPDAALPQAYGMELAASIATLRRALAAAEGGAGIAANTLVRGGETRAGGAKFMAPGTP